MRLFSFVAIVLIGLSVARSAEAEIVRLNNGRVLTVEMCRFEGDVVVLVMPGGGEIRAPKALVAELLPDEVPDARPVAIEALAASPSSHVQLGASVIREMVDRIAQKVGLDRKLAHAVVSVESNYQPSAISPKGAMGLMQIMPVIVQQYGVIDPFDPEQNLEAGMRHLRSLLERFEPRRAIAAYNAGATAVVRYGGTPPYRETQNYVQRVLSALQAR